MQFVLCVCTYKCTLTSACTSISAAQQKDLPKGDSLYVIFSVAQCFFISFVQLNMIHDIYCPLPPPHPFFETRPHYVVRSGLELTETHLSLPPENQRPALLCPTLLFTSFLGKGFPGVGMVVVLWVVYLFCLFILRHDLILQPKLA